MTDEEQGADHFFMVQNKKSDVTISTSEEESDENDGLQDQSNNNSSSSSSSEELKDEKKSFDSGGGVMINGDTIVEGGQELMKVPGPAALSLMEGLDLEPAVMLDKEEVRKSILKGKSELLRSRQKNNISKAVPVEQTNFRPIPASARKVVVTSPSNTEGEESSDDSDATPQPSNSALTTSRRSMSQDDLAGMVSGAKVSPDAPRPARRTSGTTSSNNMTAKSGKHSPQAGSLATPKKSKAKKITVEDMSGAQQAVQLLSSLCPPPRRPSSTGNLPFVESPVDGVGVSRSTPGRSKSGSQRHANKKGSPPRTASLDGFSEPDTGPTMSPLWNIAVGSGGEEELSTSRHSVENSPAATKMKNGCTSTGQQEDKESSRSNRDHQTEGGGPGLKKTGDETNDPSLSESARHSARSEKSSSQSAGNKDGYLNETGIIIEIWACWACEYDNNPSGHVFCGMCGTGRDWHCPSCEHDNKSTFNFCGMCGTRKGRVVLHKDQPEGFDMKMRKATTTSKTSRRKKATMKKSSNSRSSRASSPSNKSVTSARSAGGRRSSAILSNKPKLPSTADEMAGVSDRMSVARSADGSDQPPPTPSREKERRSRGRGRDSIKGSGGGVTGSRSRKKDPSRTRSTSRVGKDGKERRKSRASFVERGDEKKSSRRDKSSRRNNKGEKSSVRRPRNATSVPPGERPGEGKPLVNGKPTTNLPMAAQPRPGLSRSSSLPKIDLGDSIHKANATDTETGKGGKSWLKKTVGISKVPTPWKSSSEDKDGGDLNTTDHSTFRSSDTSAPAPSALDMGLQDTTRTNDGLPTPSIKKRLLKMGGKVGGKLFTSAPLADESERVLAQSKQPIRRTLSSDGIETKAPTQQKDGDSSVPSTPSLKKRFLGKVWKKSDHGKPAQLLPLEASEENTVSEAEDIELAESDEEYFNPLEGLSQGLVVTAKDMRPNRPNVNRRQQRRRSNKGNLGGTTDSNNVEKRKNERNNRRRPGRTKSGESVGSRRYSMESDGSSISGGDGNIVLANTAEVEANTEDPLGDRLSEAESINSMEFD